MVRRGVVRVGTSGWRYRAWRGDFYPAGLPQRRELEYLAGHTDAVELARGHTLADDRVGWPPAEASHRLQHVLEPRHVSWEDPAVVRRLRRRGLTVAVSDDPRQWPVLDVDTTRVRYVRLHGHTDLHTSGYDAAALAEWARLARGWADAGQDVWVFFDNDARGRAPHDAVALRRELALPGAMLPG